MQNKEVLICWILISFICILTTSWYIVRIIALIALFMKVYNPPFSAGRTPKYQLRDAALRVYPFS